jgi:hypothetical protein
MHLYGSYTNIIELHNKDIYILNDNNNSGIKDKLLIDNNKLHNILIHDLITTYLFTGNIYFNNKLFGLKTIQIYGYIFNENIKNIQVILLYTMNYINLIGVLDWDTTVQVIIVTMIKNFKVACILLDINNNGRINEHLVIDNDILQDVTMNDVIYIYLIDNNIYFNKLIGFIMLSIHEYSSKNEMNEVYINLINMDKTSQSTILAIHYSVANILKLSFLFFGYILSIFICWMYIYVVIDASTIIISQICQQMFITVIKSTIIVIIVIISFASSIYII